VARFSVQNSFPARHHSVCEPFIDVVTDSQEAITDVICEELFQERLRVVPFIVPDLELIRGLLVVNRLACLADGVGEFVQTTDFAGDSLGCLAKFSVQRRQCPFLVLN